MNLMGYINMPQNNYSAMIEKMKTAEDVEVMKDAYIQFVGHRNLITQTVIDKLMLQALNID